VPARLPLVLRAGITEMGTNGQRQRHESRGRNGRAKHQADANTVYAAVNTLANAWSFKRHIELRQCSVSAKSDFAGCKLVYSSASPPKRCNLLGRNNVGRRNEVVCSHASDTGHDRTRRTLSEMSAVSTKHRDRTDGHIPRICPVSGDVCGLMKGPRRLRVLLAGKRLLQSPTDLHRR